MARESHRENPRRVVYYGQRHYSPGLGRWTSRDPLGERGGANLYAFVFNASTGYQDILGMYPASEGHGTIESPDAALSRINRIVRQADSRFDRGLQNVTDWQQRYVSRARSLARLDALTDRDLLGYSVSNVFVYTCKYGWIDHGHLFNNALITYVSNEGWAELGSFLNEVVQTTQFRNESSFSSRWTPEDLVSNNLGRDLGREMKRYDPSLRMPSVSSRPHSRYEFYPIGMHMADLYRDAGAVASNAHTLKWLKRDLSDFREDPMHYANTISRSREYYESTETWKCLCDGDQPKREQGRW